eukprot:GHVH01003575.1.p1 GENE.GHVH01003575.1~~GHVH01003575.1.p1  ORF type:complete len:217 (+),score=30.69 GHVH01003575.1:1077-1727(+)
MVVRQRSEVRDRLEPPPKIQAEECVRSHSRSRRMLTYANQSSQRRLNSDQVESTKGAVDPKAITAAKTVFTETNRSDTSCETSSFSDISSISLSISNLEKVKVSDRGTSSSKSGSKALPETTVHSTIAKLFDGDQAFTNKTKNLIAELISALEEQNAHEEENDRTGGKQKKDEKRKSGRSSTAHKEREVQKREKKHSKKRVSESKSKKRSRFVLPD